MFKLIIKRLGLMIPLLIIISMVVFALAIIQPGDPFSGQHGTNIKQEASFENEFQSFLSPYLELSNPGEERENDEIF